MSTTTPTAVIDQARRTGARACLDAMSRLENATIAREYKGSDDQPIAEYFGDRLSMVREFVANLGPMTPEIEGAVAALAEYVCWNVTSGTPNLDADGWVPMAAMTYAEFARMIESIET